MSVFIKTQKCIYCGKTDFEENLLSFESTDCGELHKRKRFWTHQDCLLDRGSKCIVKGVEIRGFSFPGECMEEYVAVDLSDLVAMFKFYYPKRYREDGK